MIDTCVHSGRAPAHVDQEVVEHLAAAVGVHDLGVELQPEEPALGVVHGGDRRPGDDAVATNPAGTSVMASPWLIHTDDVAGQSGNSGDFGAAPSDSVVRPYSPCPVRDTVPPSCSAMSCAP